MAAVLFEEFVELSKMELTKCLKRKLRHVQEQDRCGHKFPVGDVVGTAYYDVVASGAEHIYSFDWLNHM